MKLIRLGDYIQPVDNRNIDEKYDESFVRGISTKKEFIETKANLNGVSLKGYKVVPQECFAYVSDTSRRGDKMSLAYNDSKSIILVSSISTVFKIINKNVINPLFLYMFFKRSEFDRYARFNSWGSARETFDWNDFCDIKIELPSIEIQNKYVAIYKAMQDNLKVYQSKLDDLKLVCDAYIEKLKKKYGYESIGKYIREIDVRNKDNKFTNFQGICMDGVFITPMRISISPETLKIVKNGQLVYNKATECVTDRFIIAQREEDTCVVSNSYIVFESIDDSKLSNDYLSLWMHRKEFARYSRFHSHGTTHEYFEFKDMQEVMMPIPPIEVQNSITAIYKSYSKRKIILNNLNEYINNICPILVKGAIQEGEKEKNE